MRLLVLDDYEGAIATAPALDRLKGLAEVTILQRPLAEDDYARLKDYEIIVAIRERTQLDARFFAACSSLELLLQTGGHAYHVDTPAATALGIPIALGRRVITPTRVIPELVFALMLGLIKHIHKNTAGMKEGEWPQYLCGSVFGRTLGILGYGRLGKPVAEIAKAFGMKIIAWDRSGNLSGKSDNGVLFLPLEELLARSEFVSIHLKLSEESRGLFNRERFNQMRPGAFLINTSRGAIVDENALAEALISGRLSGAGLDVFETEPLPPDSQLRTLDNVLLTPHIGWKVSDLFHEFVAIAADQLDTWLNGRLPVSEILNPMALESERPRMGGVR